VTGGARGIGGAISTVLAEDGATVAVLGLPEDRERTHNLAARLNGAASRIHFYQSDVSIYDQCRETVAAVLQGARTHRFSGQQRGDHPRPHGPQR
jgi:NAD(P)-dependent dehydrogenase (short-subunit alcohol dehydrogenase family)